MTADEYRTTDYMEGEMKSLLEAAKRAEVRWERERVNGMGFLAWMVEDGASDAAIAEVVRATAISKRGAYERFRDDLRAAIAKAEGNDR